MNEGEEILSIVVASIKTARRNKQSIPVSAIRNPKSRTMPYLTSIGLEVHVQLKTRSKMFCGCPVEFGAAPNSHTCPTCLGLPGALPVMNHEALRLTVLTGLMLGCDIAPISKFDRKNYFYPDMPKNYQITQYESAAVREWRRAVA